ncbi:hypothetical protein VKT23_003678 [Stygiomarasmius scandens]|uniref:Uncharacterized protein n=1 Tax=Marasmiellus scandens TaxID=2682957 RepID=A0ABR1K4C9_9AGAR
MFEAIFANEPEDPRRWFRLNVWGGSLATITATFSVTKQNAPLAVQPFKPELRSLFTQQLNHHYMSLDFVNLASCVYAQLVTSSQSAPFPCIHPKQDACQICDRDASVAKGKLAPSFIWARVLWCVECQRRVSDFLEYLLACPPYVEWLKENLNSRLLVLFILFRAVQMLNHGSTFSNDILAEWITKPCLLPTSSSPCGEDFQMRGLHVFCQRHYKAVGEFGGQLPGPFELAKICNDICEQVEKGGNYKSLVQSYTDLHKPRGRKSDQFLGVPCYRCGSLCNQKAIELPEIWSDQQPFSSKAPGASPMLIPSSAPLSIPTANAERNAEQCSSVQKSEPPQVTRVIMDLVAASDAIIAATESITHSANMSPALRDALANLPLPTLPSSPPVHALCQSCRDKHTNFMQGADFISQTTHTITGSDQRR